jgi:hypothetical protein
MGRSNAGAWELLKMTAQNFYPASYEASRQAFYQDVTAVRQSWPAARLISHPLAPTDGEEQEDGKGLTLDWIEADALERPEKLLIFTAGEHGIEGYAGAALFELFLQEFLPRLDPRATGLRLVHCINPWGMQQRRKVKANGVDLNRNFVWDTAAFSPAANPDYARFAGVFNPTRPLRSYTGGQLAFVAALLRAALTTGVHRFSLAATLGQYRFPKGFYYGGDAIQEETRLMMDLYRAGVQQYQHIALLDMHSGFGPRGRISVICSPLEPRRPEDLQRSFAYPQVVKTTDEKFYPILGDMIDYIYTLVQHDAPRKSLFAATLEMGTLGDSTFASARSLIAMIMENQVYCHGAGSQDLRQRVEQDFEALYRPADPQWQASVLADARQAFQGILKAEGFIE